MTQLVDSIDQFPPATAPILRCFERVHGELGPGFAPAVYRQALTLELRRRGDRCLAACDVEVFYRDEPMGLASPDLIVEGELLVVIEVSRLLTVDRANRLAGLVRATGWPAGVLLNFGHIAEYWLVTQSGHTAGSLGGFTTMATTARPRARHQLDRAAGS